MADRVFDFIAEIPGRYQAWTKRLAERPRLQFLWHMGLALCGLVLFFTAIEPLVYSDAFWWIFVYSLPVLIGLLIWFLRRVYRRHGPSPLLGLLMAILILFGIQLSFMVWDAGRALAMFPETEAEAQAAALPADIPAIDLTSFLYECHETCSEVMVKTGKNVFAHDRMFSLVTGDMCRTGEMRASYLQMLKAGHVDTCVRMEQVPQRPAEIIEISRIRCDAWQVDAGLCLVLPESFDGSIFAVRTHRAKLVEIGQRWIIGEIRPSNPWFGLIGLGGWGIGRLKVDKVYISRALGIEIQGYGVTGDGELDAVLTGLESFLDHPEETQLLSSSDFATLARERGAGNEAVLLAHAQRLMARDGREHILAGLNLVTPDLARQSPTLRPQLEALGNHADPFIRDLAARLLKRMGTP